MTHTEALRSCAGISAAISEVVFGSKEYDGLYRRIADNVGGFPGIWMIVADAAVEVFRREELHPEIWESMDLPTLSEKIGSAILQLDDAPADYESLVSKAMWSIRDQDALNEQRELANDLMSWHGGQSSGVYAVGSCMSSDTDRGLRYSTTRHYGHVEAVRLAIAELQNLKRDANFPETVGPAQEAECNALAEKLKAYLHDA